MMTQQLDFVFCCLAGHFKKMRQSVDKEWRRFLVNRLSSFAFLIVFMASSFAQAGSGSFAGKKHQHEFKEGDTLWFLSQIYYGDGAQYTRILEANQLKSAGAVRDGQKLVIPGALFTPEQPGFDIRLAHLREKRAQNLAKRLMASESAPTAEPAKTVVIPKYTPKLPSNLPFTEVRDRHHTPTYEKAKAELIGK